MKEKNEYLRVIIVGGDGSVMWVLEEMIKVNIKFDYVPIGIIPTGTGNDFARSLGLIYFIFVKCFF